MATTKEEYYVVTWGDTLTKIAKQYNTTVEALVELNDIKDPDKIVVGQKIQVSGNKKSSSSNGNTVKVTAFGLLANTTRNIYATWAWDKVSTTKNYEIRWWRLVKQSVTNKELWIFASKTTTDSGTVMDATFNASELDIAVKATIKPIANTSSSEDLEIANWTGAECAEQIYYFDSNPPSAPSNLNVEIVKYQLKITLDNLAEDVESVEFQIVKNHTTTVSNTKMSADVTTGHVEYVYTVETGAAYKVRCRAWKGAKYSEWSEYSSSVKSRPSVPKLNEVKALSESSIRLTWSAVLSSEKYDIEYVIVDSNIYNRLVEDLKSLGEVLSTENIRSKYFGIEGVEVQNVTVETDVESDASYVSKQIEGIKMGTEYLVRVNASNLEATSEWSNIESFIVGKKPTAPTTWSSTTKAIIGEPLNLYWAHNSADGSSQEQAFLEMSLYSQGSKVSEYTWVVNNLSGIKDDDKIYISDYVGENKDKTRICEVKTDSNVFKEGYEIRWRVKTAGVLTDDVGPVYGDYSILRTVNLYSPPTLELNVTDVEKNPIYGELTSFPFYINMSAGNSENQKPTGYYVSIISDSAYETVDDLGNTKIVSEGTKVYSKYFDTSESNLEVEISASDLSLESNKSYTIACTLAMNSGLIANATSKFKVSWANQEFFPFAEIGVDKDCLSAYIRPYCNSEEDVTLSVYRREFDGSFTEIAKDLTNGTNTFVVDPHPALDYARYRVVAKSNSTGLISYNDIPGYKIGEKAIVIQWDENWSDFDLSEDAGLVTRPWSGSMLKLMFDIKISDNTNPDVETVEYIGRKYPVSYYGTQLRSTSSWTCNIPKTDKETLYAIRRLSAWMGNAYVRDPNGTGYWANVKLQYNINSRELVIPITFNITRVEGGM